MTDFRQYIDAHYDDIVNALMEAAGNAYRFPAWGQEVSLLRDADTGEIKLITKDCLAGENDSETSFGEDGTLRLHTVFSPFAHILWDYWFDNFKEAIAAAEEHFGVTFKRDSDGDFLDEDGDWFEADLRETLSVCCRAAGIREADLEDWLDEQIEEAIEFEISEAKQSGYFDEIIERAIRKTEAD